MCTLDQPMHIYIKNWFLLHIYIKNHKNKGINDKLFRLHSQENYQWRDIAEKIEKLEFQLLANSSDKNTIIQRNNSKVADKTDRTPIFSEHLTYEVKAGVDTFRLYKQDDGLHVRVHLLHKPIVSYPYVAVQKLAR